MEHITSRFSRISGNTIEELLRAHEDGRDLGRIVPGMSRAEASVAVTEILDARRFLAGNGDAADPGGLGDWTLALMAEVAMISAETCWAMGPRGMDRARQMRAWVLTTLEQACDSPWKSPLVVYEDMFSFVAHELGSDGNPRSIDLVRRAIAHNLRHGGGRRLERFLLQLADVHMCCGDHPRGLEILTVLVRNDPAIRNTPGVCLQAVGHPDPDELRRDLERAGVDVEGLEQELERLSAAQPGDGADRGPYTVYTVDDETTARFREAMAMEPDEGEGRPLPDLARDIIPGLESIPVKRPVPESGAAALPVREAS